MKKVVFLPAIFLFVTLFSVTTKAQNTSYTVKHDTCLNKKFSVVFYVVLDSINSMPGTSAANVQNHINAAHGTFINNIINSLNTNFSRICVSFENCKTIPIPNYEYNDWSGGVTDSVVFRNWYTENTINIYLAQEVGAAFCPSDPFIYCSPTPTATTRPRDFFVMGRAPGATPRATSIIHTFGHYFGLANTYAELSNGNQNLTTNHGPSQELVNGSNSQTKGDFISDTYADPFPTGFEPLNTPAVPFVPPCRFHYEKGLKDANGNYYTPPVDNYMSGYTPPVPPPPSPSVECRCRFTQEQYNRMAYYILTKRMYLH